MGRARGIRELELNLDDTICLCFHVTKRKILNFLRVHRPRRASELSQCGGAGTGCGWCRKTLQRYFEAAGSGMSGGPADDESVTPATYAEGREAYIAAGHGAPPKPSSGSGP